MTSIRFVLPCNPAFISQSGPNMYSAQLFIGSDASQIETVQHLVDGDSSPQFVQSLFQNPQLQTETNVQMTFRSDHFGMALIPERLTYASVIRDQSYPLIAIEAMQERAAIGQLGGEIYDHLYAGLQLRFVDRTFVANEFSLFDAITQGASAVLPVQHQDALYVEPGLAYILKDQPWQPRVSIKVSNVGFANQQYSDIPMQPIVDTGVGVAPPLGLGELELALAYRSGEDDYQTTGGLRLGASYSLGLLQAIIGLGRDNNSIGVISSVGSVRAGITFSENHIDEGDGSALDAKTIFTEFGVVY
jgi:hypothetical protein